MWRTGKLIKKLFLFSGFGSRHTFIHWCIWVPVEGMGPLCQRQLLQVEGNEMELNFIQWSLILPGLGVLWISIDRDDQMMNHPKSLGPQTKPPKSHEPKFWPPKNPLPNFQAIEISRKHQMISKNTFCYNRTLGTTLQNVPISKIPEMENFKPPRIWT